MLLSVSRVRKSFGVDVVLSEVSFRIDEREKVALVGRNGAGKSTLLRLITQQDTPDAGSIMLRRGARIGYLRQEAPVTAGRTVLEEAQSSLQQQIGLRKRLDELEAAMDSGSASTEELDEYALIHEHFVENKGYSVESDVRVVLKQMGFEEDEFDKPTSGLSGGEKTRLAIARLLLEEPDLLILDEPTNHLDLQATEWLESWVRGYHGAVLLVSHDRAFLENTVQRVLDLREGQVKSYPGDFSQYRELRHAEELRLAEVARQQEREIAKLDEYVRRFMNSQRTAQARGRLKLMNRLTEQKVEAPKNDKGMKAGFGSVARSGDLVLECRDWVIGYGTPLFPALSWTVRIGERWGVIGENGAGKSTLVQSLLGHLDPLSGTYKLGANVSVGFFRQDGADFDPEMSPLDYCVWELDMEPQPARDLLGRFLFSGDDVYRPIGTFSGGEKNKLALAKLTHQNPNLLVLDEPTNHLDMASREALADVLKAYRGTLVMVSHDRWLLDKICDRTLDVRRSGVISFEGGFREYHSRQSSGLPPKTGQPKSGSAPEPIEPELSPRELSKEIQRVAKVVESLEQQVGDLESDLSEIEATLASVSPTEDVLAMSLDHQRTKEDLDAAMAAWEEQSLHLASLQAKQGG